MAGPAPEEEGRCAGPPPRTGEDAGGMEDEGRGAPPTPTRQSELRERSWEVAPGGSKLGPLRALVVVCAGWSAAARSAIPGSCANGFAYSGAGWRKRPCCWVHHIYYILYI